MHIQNIPSVGQEAARLMELDSDKERWRQVAKEWFARGLAITPNSGKLQHHLGLLCRDKDSTDETDHKDEVGTRLDRMHDTTRTSVRTRQSFDCVGPWCTSEATRLDVVAILSGRHGALSSLSFLIATPRREDRGLRYAVRTSVFGDGMQAIRDGHQSYKAYETRKQ